MKKFEVLEILIDSCKPEELKEYLDGHSNMELLLEYLKCAKSIIWHAQWQAYDHPEHLESGLLDGLKTYSLLNKDTLT